MMHVIKECHLRMLTMELCPQGSCDLVQQVVLSFSAALPSVHSYCCPTPAFAEIEPLTSLPSQNLPQKRAPTKGSSALLDQCDSPSMLPLNIPGLENLLLIATLARKMMKDELSRQEKQKLV